MEAPAVFENILQQIQTSNLNFKLELSPFSANISMKKSFIRSKAGKGEKRTLELKVKHTY